MTGRQIPVSAAVAEAFAYFESVANEDLSSILRTLNAGLENLLKEREPCMHELPDAGAIALGDRAPDTALQCKERTELAQTAAALENKVAQLVVSGAVEDVGAAERSLSELMSLLVRLEVGHWKAGPDRQVLSRQLSIGDTGRWDRFDIAIYPDSDFESTIVWPSNRFSPLCPEHDAPPLLLKVALARGTPLPHPELIADLLDSLEHVDDTPELTGLKAEAGEMLGTLRYNLTWLKDGGRRKAGCIVARLAARLAQEVVESRWNRLARAGAERTKACPQRPALLVRAEETLARYHPEVRLEPRPTTGGELVSQDEPGTPDEYHLKVLFDSEFARGDIIEGVWPRSRVSLRDSELPLPGSVLLSLGPAPAEAEATARMSLALKAALRLEPLQPFAGPLLAAMKSAEEQYLGAQEGFEEIDVAGLRRSLADRFISIEDAVIGEGFSAADRDRVRHDAWSQLKEELWNLLVHAGVELFPLEGSNIEAHCRPDDEGVVSPEEIRWEFGPADTGEAAPGTITAVLKTGIRLDGELLSAPAVVLADPAPVCRELLGGMLEFLPPDDALRPDVEFALLDWQRPPVDLVLNMLDRLLGGSGLSSPPSEKMAAFPGRADSMSSELGILIVPPTSWDRAFDPDRMSVDPELCSSDEPEEPLKACMLASFGYIERGGAVARKAVVGIPLGSFPPPLEALLAGPEQLVPFVNLEDDATRRRFASELTQLSSPIISELKRQLLQDGEVAAILVSSVAEGLLGLMDYVRRFLLARPEELPGEVTDGAVAWYNTLVASCCDAYSNVELREWSGVSDVLEREASRRLVRDGRHWAESGSESPIICQVASNEPAGTVVARLGGVLCTAPDSSPEMESVLIPECIIISSGPRHGLFYEVKKSVGKAIRSEQADTDTEEAAEDRELLEEMRAIQTGYERTLFTRDRDRLSLQLINLLDRKERRRARYGSFLDSLVRHVSDRLGATALELSAGTVFDDSQRERFEVEGDVSSGIVKRTIRRCFLAADGHGLVQKGLVEFETD